MLWDTGTEGLEGFHICVPSTRLTIFLVNVESFRVGGKTKRSELFRVWTLV